MFDLHSRQATLRGWIRLFLLLGVTVAALLLVSSRAPTEEALALLPWFCSVFIAFLAPVFVAAGTDLFSPPGLIGLNGALATAAMMALILRDGGVEFDALGFLPMVERVALARGAAVLMLVSHIAYLIGYYRASGKLAYRIFPSVGGRRWQGGRLLIVLVATSILVVPFYYYFQQRMGGSAVLDVTQLARGKKVIREDPTLSWMVRGILFAFVPTLLLACMAIVDRSKRLLALTGIVFVLVAVLVTRLGPRQPAIAAGFIILVLFHYLWRKINPSIVVGFLLMAVVTVNVLGSYRTTGESKVGFAQGMADPMESMAQHEEDRNRLQVLAVLLYYFPERQDYLLGESYAAFSVFWVPRWLWPEKVESFEWWGTRIVQRLAGLPAPVPFYGELYANFSWFGVVIGMALFGAFHRGLARYRERSPNDVGVTLIYTVVATSFTPTTLGVSATLQYALPLTLLVYAVSRRARPLPPPGETDTALPA